MPINAVINGIRAVIDAIPVSGGPAGLPAQFQSHEGTGASRPVFIRLNEPVKEFTVEVVGPTFPGNQVVAFDQSGIEIGRAESSNYSRDPITVPVTVIAPPDRYIHSIQLLPAVNDYVAYKNIYVKKPSDTISPPSIPSSPSPSFPVIALTDVVRFSETTINRSYQKDSLNAIAPHVIVLTNISEVYDVYLEFAQSAGIKIVPSAMLLRKNSTQNIELQFDVVTINSYSEGTSRVTFPVRLTSKVQLVPPEYESPSFPSPVPPIIPNPNTPIGTVPLDENGIPIIIFPDRPLESVPISDIPPGRTWMSAYSGDVQIGYPPSDWVQEASTGLWYAPDDLYKGNSLNISPTIPVLNNIDVSAQVPPVNTSGAPSSENPIEIQDNFRIVDTTELLT